jgi:hypothetical protein
MTVGCFNLRRSLRKIKERIERDKAKKKEEKVARVAADILALA